MPFTSAVARYFLTPENFSMPGLIIFTRLLLFSEATLQEIGISLFNILLQAFPQTTYMDYHYYLENQTE